MRAQLVRADSRLAGPFCVVLLGWQPVTAPFATQLRNLDQQVAEPDAPYPGDPNSVPLSKHLIPG